MLFTMLDCSNFDVYIMDINAIITPFFSFVTKYSVKFRWFRYIFCLKK